MGKAPGAGKTPSGEKVVVVATVLVEIRKGVAFEEGGGGRVRLMIAFVVWPNDPA